jgi:type IV pilus assembly protein PilC
VVVVIAIFTFVLPSFFDMFEGMELPLPTRVVMAISAFLTTHWLYLLIGVVGMVAIVISVFKMPEPKHAWDHFKLRVPKVKKLLITIYTSRFARTLSSLYVSGIPMIHALNIAKATIGNKYIERQFEGVIGDLANGRTLSQSLVKVKGFEPKLYSTILIGEESGRLEQMLESVADQFDYDSEMASQRLVALLEPLLIVVMAVVVMFIMISVMMPIYQMYSNIGQDI